MKIKELTATQNALLSHLQFYPLQIHTYGPPHHTKLHSLFLTVPKHKNVRKNHFQPLRDFYISLLFYFLFLFHYNLNIKNIQGTNRKKIIHVCDGVFSAINVGFFSAQKYMEKQQEKLYSSYVEWIDGMNSLIRNEFFYSE